MSEANTPIEIFSKSHEGIFEKLQALNALPALLQAAADARRIAAETLEFFHNTVRTHHEEEERDLFPAVLSSAQPQAEQVEVQAHVSRLTREHREVEAQFARLEAALRAAAKGHDTALDTAELAALIDRYTAHARFEEAVFLPLAERILGRNSKHMAALGLSIHLRHALPEVLARYGSRI